MTDDAFSNWLINVDGRDNRQRSDSVSRARRVEEALSVNLDVEYQKDKCDSVLEMLSIDYVSKMPASINLPRDKNGLASLRTAINKYIKFCNKQNNSKFNRSI